MNASPDIKDLAAALCKAQSQMEGAKKDSLNPHFNSRYADLASVVDAIRGPFAEHGLAYLQLPVPTERDEVVVETVLLHASGQWVSSVFSIPVTKADAHGHMSALTYCRRGALAAIAGVAPEDDDGNAAVASAPVAKPAGVPAPAPCPVCGKRAIIKGREEYGGGWLCFNKRGGCGAKWPEGPYPVAAPTTAQRGETLDQEAARLFPDPAPPQTGLDTAILRGRIQARWDKVGAKEPVRLKQWAQHCSSAKYMAADTPAPALEALLAALGEQ